MMWWTKIRTLFFRRRLEREMAEEMQAHLDELTERNLAAGMSATEARHAARRAFGGVEQIKERARDVRAFRWLEQGWQDLRYAVRSLTRSPSFTITAVATLALGVGVNAALFSLYNAVALKSLPVADPDRLVRITGRSAQGAMIGGFGYAEYLAYRDGSHTLQGLLAFAERRWAIQREGEAPPEMDLNGNSANMVMVEMVSENYFEVLGELVQFGRGFQSDEMHTGEPVIVLSHMFWQTQLHGDLNVIGTSLRLDGRMYTVIGVTPPGFSGEQALAPAGWLPYSQWSSQPDDFEAAGPQGFRLIGRLKPGVTEAQAKADLDAIAAKWAADFPGEKAKTSVYLKRGLPFTEIAPTGRGLIALGTLFFGFALVLVIACTNVSNLLFARGISRQREIGVRLALGAGRGRIIRQLLTENGLLCLVGAVVGLGLGIWLLQAVLPLLLAPVAPQALLMAINPWPDWRVVGFTAVLTLGATLAAGLLPALYTARADFNAVLHQDGAAWGGRLTPGRLRRLLLIVQVAVCLMLLSCAGVLARGLLSLKTNERGFDPHAVFTAALIPNATMADKALALRQALTAVRTIPGVAGIGMVHPMPFGESYGVRTRIQVVGAAAGGADQEVQTSFITGGFFETLGVSLQRGRTFGEIEQQAAARVIIVSESLARQLWPGQDAVGKTLAVNEEAFGRGQVTKAVFRECEVIGVAPDVATQTGEDGHRAMLYQPLAFDRPVYAGVMLRPYRDAIAARIEVARAAQGRGVGVQWGRPLSAKVEQMEQVFLGFAVLSCSLGALALTMASVGLYGLMTFAVNQRVREIGVRIAVGATAGAVVGLFVRQSMRLVAIGLGLGLLGACMFALFLEKVLFGFSGALDPVAFGVVTVIFAVIALFACWLPARRAAKVDPMIALRAE